MLQFHWFITFNYYTIIFRSKLESAEKGSKSSQPKNAPAEDLDDMGIVIVEDEPDIDREKINEMRRAYLEEARSQDTSD